MAPIDQLAKIVLDSARRTAQSQKSTAERAIEQLNDSQLHQRITPATNSVAIILAHVAGNLRSRWTNFLSTDGEKPWRNRDAEFIERQVDRAALLHDWEDGWRCLFDTLNQLSAKDLLERVTIRGESLEVPAAIERSIAHAAYHVGQILMQARILAGDSWQMITIPIGESEKY
ncbi:MAG: DUF1572 family protein, partial [Planctomycetales bacterium]|nr:DUF1572 family protein [Planctomycetales bacterium]